MAAPLITILMPAYNHAEYVGDAIESVLGQTVEDFEFIIIDDGSTDATSEVIQSYTDPRILFLDQANQDAYNTLNRGLNLARGNFISILNSDDLYTYDRLKTILYAIEEIDAACVFTGVVPINESGAEITDLTHPWNQWYLGLRAHFASCPSLYHGFLKGNVMVSTSNMFFSREVLEKTGPFAKMRYLHDYDYIFRVLQRFEPRTLFLPTHPLLKYRVHSRNTLLQGAIDARLQDLALIRRSLYLRIPTDLHSYLDVGIARLVELNEELRAYDVGGSKAEGSE